MRAVKGIYDGGVIRLTEPVSPDVCPEVTVLLTEPDEKINPVLEFAGLLSDLTPEEQAAFEESLRHPVKIQRVVDI